MKKVIDPIDRAVLRQELNAERFLRSTRKGGNEIYRVNASNSPAVLQEIGRLRELTFRAAGGGTGEALDLDEHDFGPYAIRATHRLVGRGPRNHRRLPLQSLRRGQRY